MKYSKAMCMNLLQYQLTTQTQDQLLPVTSNTPPDPPAKPVLLANQDNCKYSTGIVLTYTYPSAGKNSMKTWTVRKTDMILIRLTNVDGQLQISAFVGPGNSIGQGGLKVKGRYLMTLTFATYTWMTNTILQATAFAYPLQALFNDWIVKDPSLLTLSSYNQWMS